MKNSEKKEGLIFRMSEKPCHSCKGAGVLKEKTAFCGKCGEKVTESSEVRGALGCRPCDIAYSPDGKSLGSLKSYEVNNAPDFDDVP